MTLFNQEGLWVLRAQCDDREALELLLRHVQPSLRRYLAGIVGSADADDVLQEVLLIVCRKLKWLRDPALFRPWAFRIASREGFRHMKKRARWSQATEDEARLDERASSEAPPDAVQVQDFLAANEVSPGSSAVLTLHFQEDMPLAEVAAVLELPLGTVKSRLAYGLAALRRKLTDSRRR